MSFTLNEIDFANYTDENMKLVLKVYKKSSTNQKMKQNTFPKN